MALALKQAGIGDFLVLDRATDLGGTWRDNTYPGLACDVPSNLYSFSFRPGRWSRRFPPRQEILAYLHALADERGLGPHLRFGTGRGGRRVRRAPRRMESHPGGWRHAAGGRRRVGRRPAGPARPFRTSRAATTSPARRGTPPAGTTSVDLTGRRVAVVGTGASAIQFVPEIAKTAAQVDVYQRSAPYVLPKFDRPYRDAEQDLFDRFPAVRKADRLRIFLYGELLTSGFVLSQKLLAAPMQLWRRQLGADHRPAAAREVHPRLRDGLQAGAVLQRLVPDAGPRNVELVTDPIERIAPGGVVTAGGTARPAEVIIYGTGFRTLDFLAPMSVTGLGGRRLR